LGLSVKSRNKYVILSLSIAFIIILIVNTTSLFSSNKNPKKNKNNLNESQKKKILYVDSYHLGYEWSDGVTIGIKSVLLKRKDID